ncbi:type VI secretion system protein TssA [Halomonas sp. M5N1S17]|uniref:type VI secretion system protein TssA n=1 Tax=Halomonas alkalisoli TaxID=2907158 RepID=UPI001F1B5B6C|nr:type VI secretion system protein TssA [Halomonas alkalisoli]MCE9664770.1 type VI secretion system protein TssA [Halomonas alkalisoli]
MRITSEAHLTPLLAPLEPEGVGEPLDESSDYAWLDEEMMKIGSLQHGEVDWEGAETRATRLLGRSGKDLKVLGHLLHCLQRGGNGVRFALSLHLLAGSLEQWWDKAYPYQGPRGAKLRPRLFAQFTQRAAKLAETLDFSNAEDEHQACQAALDALLAVARDRELPDDALVELRRQLQQAQPRQAASQASASPGGGSAAASTGNGGNGGSAPAAKMPEMRLEAGNERVNRQALLKMADFLNEQSPGEALIYRLRRHAVWGGIQALPASRNGGRTELAPVAADRAADYREALSRGGDNALWQRIENSLAVSPYWLEGHRMSATLAERLGHSRCGEAIRDEAARFVARLPGLEALSFNDGTPFVDEETLRWLQSVPGGGGAPAQGDGGGDPWQAGLEQARECLAAEGLEAALTILDQGLAQAHSPRETAYWRLASADLLREAGLASLAAHHYRAVQQSVGGIGLDQWEPGLLKRLEAAP